jgi:hypothetical protein
MWWGKRKRRGTQLSRQLALGRLQDAMGQVEEQQGSSDPLSHPHADRPADSPEQDAMLAADGPAARSDQPSASEPTPDLPTPDLPTPDLPTPDLPTPDLSTPDLPAQLPTQRRPGRPAPRPAGPDSSAPSAPSSPQAGGSARDRLLC